MVQNLDPNMTWPCPRCKVPQVVTAMYCANCAQPLGAAPPGPPVVTPLPETVADMPASRPRCPSCGATNGADLVTCSNCGKPLKSAAVTGLRYPGVALAGVLLAAGSFLPWAALGLFSKNGIDGDGVFTLVGGIILVFLAFTAAKRTTQIIGVLVSAGCLYVVITDGAAIADISRNSLGGGLLVAGLGALVGAIASLEGR